MWLSDFEEAIKNVKAIIGDCCFMRMVGLLTVLQLSFILILD